MFSALSDKPVLPTVLNHNHYVRAGLSCLETWPAIFDTILAYEHLHFFSKESNPH